MLVEPVRTVPEVLEKFDSTSSDFLSGLNDGKYVFWLGSGISRERVPNVRDLLERVMEYLRSHIDKGNADCEYRVALNDVLQFACLTSTEFGSINLSTAVREWDLRDRILSVLVSRYSSVLDVPVGDEKPDDYLVWAGLDVQNEYGAPDLEPDVEHFCIAILLLEGLVPTAVTANWDGLLEKALSELTPASAALVRVVVKPEDFRETDPGIDIIKFHGCAVRAREFPDKYRNSLIARESQISQWTAQPENQSIKKHLETLYTDSLTLMLGLSAQDANLHSIFARAIQDLARQWPASPPPILLSEERLESYHRNLLRITFGGNYKGNSKAIAESALLGAYAKPTLLALVLACLTEKLSYLLSSVIECAWGKGAAREMQNGIFELRAQAANYAQPNMSETHTIEEVSEFQRQYTTQLIDVVSMTLATFRTGLSSNGSVGYQPLSNRPIAHSVLNADFPARQFGRLGVALALIGRGLSEGQWSAVPGDSKSPGEGVIRLLTGHGDARVFFVKDTTALMVLELNGALDDSGASSLVVVADKEPRIQTRSPRPRFGRDGKTRAGRFNVESSIADTCSVDDLYEAFKFAGGF